MLLILVWLIRPDYQEVLEAESRKTEGNLYMRARDRVGFHVKFMEMTPAWALGMLSGPGMEPVIMNTINQIDYDAISKFYVMVGVKIAVQF